MNAECHCRPRWEGDYIRWWGGSDWEWIACVKCRRPLTDPKAMSAGFGCECAADVTPAMIDSIKRAEHDACQLALEVHAQGQTTPSPWWTHQAYLKRQMLRRTSG